MINLSMTAVETQASSGPAGPPSQPPGRWNHPQSSISISSGRTAIHPAKGIGEHVLPVIQVTRTLPPASEGRGMTSPAV